LDGGRPKSLSSSIVYVVDVHLGLYKPSAQLPWASCRASRRAPTPRALFFAAPAQRCLRLLRADRAGLATELPHLLREAIGSHRRLFVSLLNAPRGASAAKLRQSEVDCRRLGLRGPED
jgi:hypothetical protein